MAVEDPPLEEVIADLFSQAVDLTDDEQQQAALPTGMERVG